MELLLKGRATPEPPPATRTGPIVEAPLGGIRCPLCDWRPKRSSRWSCTTGPGMPEPPFRSCGTVWNTFETFGRCPGCRHQWIWTLCLRCGRPSRHREWYEGSERSAAR